MKMKFIFGLILLQTGLILLLSYKIFQKQKNILGVASVIPINKNNIYYNKYSHLKYFFEPVPNYIESIPNYIKWSTARYTINFDSLNERFNYSLKKSKDTFRIVVLGDSFTFGMFVNTEENWPERLEDSLNNELRCNNIKKFEVINLGEYGYDIQYSIERYRIRGIKYSPDLVLWFLKDDDFEEINEIMRIHEKEYVDSMKKSGEYQKLSEQGNPYPPNIKMHEDMKNYINKIGEEKVLKIQEGFLKQFNSYYYNKLLIFTFPFTQKKYKDIIKGYVFGRKNSYFFDNITNIYEKSGQSFLPNDSHPNKEGHGQIATDLFSYLTKNKIISCN